MGLSGSCFPRLLLPLAAPLFALVFIQQVAYAVALAVIAALLVYRHRDNIQRLRDGTENEINL